MEKEQQDDRLDLIFEKYGVKVYHTSSESKDGKKVIKNVDNFKSCSKCSKNRKFAQNNK